MIAVRTSSSWPADLRRRRAGASVIAFMMMRRFERLMSFCRSRPIGLPPSAAARRAIVYAARVSGRYWYWLISRWLCSSVKATADAAPPAIFSIIRTAVIGRSRSRVTSPGSFRTFRRAGRLSFADCYARRSTRFMSFTGIRLPPKISRVDATRVASILFNCRLPDDAAPMA